MSDFKACDPSMEPPTYIAPYVAMAKAFVAGGAQDLQRRYLKENGEMNKDPDAPVPMFQDAASFHLGLVAQMVGMVPEAKEGGTNYAELKQLYNEIKK